MVLSDFLLQLDPPFCSNPLFCKGFHAFSGLHLRSLEPKKRFLPKRFFKSMIRLPARAPDLNFLNQKNYFESKKLFLISPSNQFRLPRERNKNFISNRRYGKALVCAMFRDWKRNKAGFASFDKIWGQRE